MTVPKSKRSPSRTLYLDRGYRVLSDMTKLATHLPRHWRGVTGDTIVTYARGAYSLACRGASIYATTYEEQPRKLILLSSER